MEIPARNAAERRVLQKMEQRDFPGSVKMTVIGAIWDEPEQAGELESLLDGGATPKEMVKAVQPIIRRALKRRGVIE